MKDAFLASLYRLNVKIYRRVMHLTYSHIDKKRAAGISRLNREQKSSIKKYWRKFGLHPKLDDYRLYLDRGCAMSPRLIPMEIWTSVIEPNQNVLKYAEAFSDKNYLDLLLGSENVPYTVLRCVSGQLLDHFYRPVTMEEATALLATERDMILKPSIDSGGGRDVRIVHGSRLAARDIEEAKNAFSGNYCVQRMLAQHEFLKNLNPTSVQTIRVVSLLKDGDALLLCASMRIGKKGNVVDNFVSGGFAVSVDIETGTIGDRLVDHDMKVYSAEECGMAAAGLKIPNWNGVREKVRALHPRLAHFGLVSWDVTLSTDATPKIVEFNLIDALVDWHQVFIGPVFGERTDELLPWLLEPRTFV